MISLAEGKKELNQKFVKVLFDYRSLLQTSDILFPTSSDLPLHLSKSQEAYELILFIYQGGLRGVLMLLERHFRNNELSALSLRLLITSLDLLLSKLHEGPFKDFDAFQVETLSSDSVPGGLMGGGEEEGSELLPSRYSMRRRVENEYHLKGISTLIQAHITSILLRLIHHNAHPIVTIFSFRLLSTLLSISSLVKDQLLQQVDVDILQDQAKHLHPTTPPPSSPVNLLERPSTAPIRMSSSSSTGSKRRKRKVMRDKSARDLIPKVSGRRGRNSDRQTSQEEELFHPNIYRGTFPPTGVSLILGCLFLKRNKFEIFGEGCKMLNTLCIKGRDSSSSIVGQSECFQANIFSNAHVELSHDHLKSQKRQCMWKLMDRRNEGIKLLLKFVQRWGIVLERNLKVRSRKTFNKEDEEKDESENQKQQQEHQESTFRFPRGNIMLTTSEERQLKKVLVEVSKLILQVVSNSEEVALFMASSNGGTKIMGQVLSLVGTKKQLEGLVRSVCDVMGYEVVVDHQNENEIMESSLQSSSSSSSSIGGLPEIHTPERESTGDKTSSIFPSKEDVHPSESEEEEEEEEGGGETSSPLIPPFNINTKETLLRVSRSDNWIVNSPTIARFQNWEPEKKSPPPSPSHQRMMNACKAYGHDVSSANTFLTPPK